MNKEEIPEGLQQTRQGLSYHLHFCQSTSSARQIPVKLWIICCPLCNERKEAKKETKERATKE